MKRSARIAYLFILLFFIFFNGLLVYLIAERIAEAKTKFGAASSNALFTALADYNKLKSIDSALKPTNGWLAYSRKKIEITRQDSQTVKFSVPSSTLVADTVEPGFVESIVNTPYFKTIDLAAFDSLFQKELRLNKINTEYRLDTISFSGGRIVRQMVPIKWEQKKRKEFQFSTGFLRLPYNSDIFIFAQVKQDPAFIKNDLVWPLLSFALVLLIGNIALVFVYKTIRKQKRINEVKNDFINNITHEMKTPITIASAGLDALEHHIPATERTNFYLQTSKKQMQLLNEFVERIVDAAVRDISEFTLKKEKIDLHLLFDELIRSHSIFPKKPVSFRLTGNVPVIVQGDRLHLETAFHNIIDNAIKYSNATVEIDIDIAENDRDCTIKIRDNGIGIQSHYTKSIFEKFFRVPQGDAQSIKGLGLGLYYVNNIVKKHSGSIVVHSEWQSGTELTITLPKNL